MLDSGTCPSSIRYIGVLKFPYSLFLFFILYRFKESLMEQQKLELKSKAVISQSGNAQKEYGRVSDEV